MLKCIAEAFVALSSIIILSVASILLHSLEI